ncbi:MAG: carbohydrate binding domain-containing protein [Planctomycetota bacterium]
MHDDAIIYKNKLIMVMGMQRSGTTALIEALGQDPALQMETEREEGPLYINHFLRPEPEIRGRLWRIKRRIILKPISEVQKRSVEDVLEEYADYGVLIAWIYRDPVNVWSSAKVKWNLSERDFQNWMSLWNDGNQKLLAAKRGRFADQIAVVRYEDLISNRNTFTNLCEFLGVEEKNNLFWGLDLNKGRNSLPRDLQDRIEASTEKTLRELHAVRLAPKRHGGFTLEENLQDVGRGSWRFEDNSITEATIYFPSEHPKTIHVAISEGVPANRLIHVHVSPLKVVANVEHVVSFWARSETPRSVHFAVGQAHAPWESFIYVADIKLTSDWKFIRRTFVPAADNDVSRIFLDLGTAPGNVFLSEPRLSVGSAPLREIYLHNGAAARLEHIPELPDVTRVEIDAPAAQFTDVQLIQHRMRLTEGESYVVTFSAKSDASRSIGVCVGQNHGPWQVAGLYERIILSPSWQTFRFRFVATAENARLYFDLGSDSNAVEISEVAVVSASHLNVRMELNHGAEATFRFPPDRPAVIRAEINKIAGKTSSDVQLVLSERPVTRGHRYAISFRARADQDRAVELNASQSNDPWSGVGILQKIDLNTSWREFHFEFNATMNEPHARVHLDMGDNDIAVEISDVCFGDGVNELNRDEIAKLRRILAAMEGG